MQLRTVRKKVIHGMVLPSDLEVPVEVADKVRGGVPPFLEFIPVANLLQPKYHREPDAKDDKALLLMLLNVKHWKEGRDKSSMVISHHNKMSLYAQGNNANQRQKTGNSTCRCNRMLFFADCLNPPCVVVKILEQHSDSVKFFGNMSHCGYGVGCFYVVEE